MTDVFVFVSSRVDSFIHHCFDEKLAVSYTFPPKHL